MHSASKHPPIKVSHGLMSAAVVAAALIGAQCTNRPERREADCGGDQSGGGALPLGRSGCSAISYGTLAASSLLHL